MMSQFVSKFEMFPTYIYDDEQFIVRISR